MTVVSSALKVLKAAEMDHRKLSAIGKRGAMLLLRDSMRSFREQKDPSSETPWKPSQRAEGLVKSRATKRKAGTGQTLLDTGLLRKSVATDFRVLTVRNGVEIKGGTLPLRYAAIHQFGGKCGLNLRTLLPARPYVGFSKESVTALDEAIVRHYHGRQE